MAPKLTPDNLCLPEIFDLDITRHPVDKDIFPMPQAAGEFQGQKEKIYVPAPAKPSPFASKRYITDVGTGSQFVRFYKDLTYQLSEVALVSDEQGHPQAPRPTVVPMPKEAEGALKDFKLTVAMEAEKRSLGSSPLNQEIIALGTGSAFPSRPRNGISLI
jgi:hypothetical protein